MIGSTAVRLLLLAVSAAPAGSSASQGREAPAPAKESGVLLSVAGKVPKPLKLDAAAFARLPRKTVKVKEHDGKEVEYEGTPLSEALAAAGLGLTAEDLRGSALRYYLVVEAADGYRALFALPELSPAFTDRVVLLADRRDGKPLDAAHGPLRLVVPGEKRQARWVRQVVGLKVGRD